MSGHRHEKRLFLFVVVFFALFMPATAHGYVGPGAGFAFLSSALALLLTFLAFFFGILLWPFRLLYRLFTWKRRPRPPRIKRAVLVGLDGVDPQRTREMIAAGRLPNLKRLADSGAFVDLQTTYPAMSPVAWSSFATGSEPSKHGIYDFFEPDPKTYVPRLSSSRIEEPHRFVEIGAFRIPLGKPNLRLLRKSKPFWKILADYRVPCAILRVPITFPPEKFAGTQLSAMCAPDVLGTQGTFTYFTSRSASKQESIGGRRVTVEVCNDRIETVLEGPPHPFRKDGRLCRVDVRLTLDRKNQSAALRVGKEKAQLQLGHFSPWMSIRFPLAPWVKLRAICRFRLLEVEPHFRLYVSPLNIDPEKPVMPISHPRYFSTFLAKLCGPFATLGLAEDTWAVNEGVLDQSAFWQQAWSIHAEREAMFFEMLRRTHKGVLACVFDTTDRIQHMYMRNAVEGDPQDPHRNAIDETYEKMDAMLGRILDQVDPDDPRNLIMVMSDHGFKPFTRGINLNAWLHKNGYLALKKEVSFGQPWLKGVDWQQTRAYSMGLAGIYLNVAGREVGGIVEAGEAQKQLACEISAKLGGLKDPKNGQTAINRVYPAAKIYHGPYAGQAPDLIVGYAPGWRASWNGARGVVEAEVFSDNEKAWSGDHCIDPPTVAGVLFSNRPPAPEKETFSIMDIAPSVVDLFGIGPPKYMDGCSLFDSNEKPDKQNKAQPPKQNQRPEAEN